MVALAAALALAVAPVRAAEPNQLTPEQIADGWISLFDGETLFGWHPTSDANWRVEEGAITVSEGEQGFLMTGVDFADYELHVEFKAPATTNSGLFLRTPLRPNDPAKDCYELNIAPEDNPFPTASLVGREKVETKPWGVVYDFNGAPTRRLGGPSEAIPAWDGQWHAFDLHVEGNQMGISLDAQLLTTFVANDPASIPARGRIALQFREGEVAFRSIRLKPLGLEPMLNGENLAGWRTDETRAADFEVAEGELHVAGGPGELETESAYGDFIMQLDCFVDGDGLNSGVFFRSIPGQFANGYESQINNGVKDGDPTQPVDAGTGAIYRRTTARRVVSKDREWFTKTIVATGSHIAVWVNGVQVTDWTDDRSPHENPRSGLRLEPGTISLQAHDPTTNLRFRNLRIAELPAAANDQ